MPRVLISASFPAELILRQTPGRQGTWQEFEFVAETGGEPVDAWVVYDDLPDPQQAICPPSNTLFMTGEPESLRRYRRRYTSQFSQVWTSHKSIHHPHVIRRNEAQHWHYALRPGSVHGCQLGLDELQHMARPNKSKLISVICSSKADTEDHRQRLEFVRQLQAHLPEGIDVFGRGIREIEDKSEAIYDYKYHIVLENDHSEHFMTEKLGDAFLGWSYPIYFGGPEAYHRFPEGSFTAINIYQPREALMLIRNVLAAEAYETNADAIAEARRRVLLKNNICNMLAEYWREHLLDEAAEPLELLPKNRRTSLVLRQFGRVVSKPFHRSRTIREAA